MNRSLLLLASAMLFSTTVYADQVTLDDAIIDGSLCVGVDCVNGEAFNFDTVRIKENNLRILFNDTSASASFPSTDWRLIANDTTNGGRNHFTIENATTSQEVFTVMGGAPESSLFIDNSGAVGIGTNAPEQTLHITSGNSPAIRLEQSTEQGFPATVWDIIVNEDGLKIAIDNTEVASIAANGDLTVAGSVTASTPGSTFPDYVFASDYPLMPLAQLQQYLHTERHLPGIPSASEVGANGLNMTEFQVQLLQKVEELTLYTLQQQSQIDALKVQLETAN
ncbi:hypothetical protein [Gilvimarinus polysaccharolyticus]|uniref:hypothetical protein n=1 Tax=Gilvimarinus polysaccharolyticus TaxID=863921 RepID=UPI0006731B3F|nr:hypothetical protein [Gilvimarinus polysaccharolyticus]